MFLPQTRRASACPIPTTGGIGSSSAVGRKVHPISSKAESSALAGTAGCGQPATSLRSTKWSVAPTAGFAPKAGSGTEGGEGTRSSFTRRRLRGWDGYAIA